MSIQKTEDDYRYISIIYHKEIDKSTGIQMHFQIEKEFLDPSLWSIESGQIDLEKDEIIQAIGKKLNADFGGCKITNAIYSLRQPPDNLFQVKSDEAIKEITDTEEYKNACAYGPMGNDQKRNLINKIKNKINTDFEKIV